MPLLLLLDNDTGSVAPVLVLPVRFTGEALGMPRMTSEQLVALPGVQDEQLAAPTMSAETVAA